MGTRRNFSRSRVRQFRPNRQRVPGCGHVQRGCLLDEADIGKEQLHHLRQYDARPCVREHAMGLADFTWLAGSYRKYLSHVDRRRK